MFCGQESRGLTERRSSGSRSAAAEPEPLYRPAKGAGIPPNDSHGDALGALSACSSFVASCALTALRLLPPSM